jgi:hypothetical protein
MPENESIPVDSTSAAAGSESVEAEEVREETPVIDVHAPHGGMHTWKDFWIHLGTITLGLLIAISLEQTVVWMHERHERHQLEADLREEGLKNRDIIAVDLDNNSARAAWLLRLRDEVDQMRASGGRVKFAYRSFAEMDPSGAAIPFLPPSSGEWETAKESAKVALLDRDKAKLYTYVYLLLEQSSDSGRYLVGVQLERNTFEARFSSGTPQGALDQSLSLAGQPDLSRMTMPELDEYSALLTKDMMAQRASRRRLVMLDGANSALLNGATTTDQLVESLQTALRIHPNQ